MPRLARRSCRVAVLALESKHAELAMCGGIATPACPSGADAEEQLIDKIKIRCVSPYLVHWQKVITADKKRVLLKKLIFNIHTLFPFT